MTILSFSLAVCATLLGVYLTSKISSYWISIIFGLALLYSAWLSWRRTSEDKGSREPEALAGRFSLVLGIHKTSLLGLERRLREPLVSSARRSALC